MTGRSSRHNILLVTNWIGWAGAETQLNYLALGLRERGHSVVLLAIGTIARDVGQLERAGVRIVALRATNPASKLWAFPKLVRHARAAEVVHCTGWDATLWGRLAAHLARRPVVITEHTPGRELQVTESGASRKWAIVLHNRLLDRFTYATIAVGRWQIPLLEGEGVRGGSILRIPNAVPVAELRRRAEMGPSRDAVGLPEDAKVIVHVARFSLQKGQLTTLRTAARLRERFGDVRVLFVGEGPGEATVKREAALLDADWAIFLGRRDDVPGLLRLADISVLPSTGEGLPMSQIEAVVLGVPVVATDVGDVRWLLTETGGGVCVPAGDDDAFEEACARLLENPKMRARIAEDGSRSAPEFDAAKMVRRYEEVLEAAIESAPLPGAAVAA